MGRARLWREPSVLEPQRRGNAHRKRESQSDALTVGGRPKEDGMLIALGLEAISAACGVELACRMPLRRQISGSTHCPCAVVYVCSLAGVRMES